MQNNFQYLKLFSLNVRMYVKFGVIGSTNNWGKILVAFVPFVTSIGQLLNLYHTWGAGFESSELGLNYFLWCATTNGLLRHLTMARKDKKIVKLLKCIEDWYKEIERYEDPHTRKQLEKVTDIAVKLTRFGLMFGSLCALVCIIRPLYYNHRKLPMDIYFPLVDITQLQLYVISFAVQLVILVPEAVCNYLPFMNLFITYLMFGQVLLMDLQHKLNNIRVGNEMEMLRKFKECLAYHNRIIAYRNDVEELFSINGLFDVTIFGGMLCMTLFFVSVEKDIKLIMTAMTFMFLPFYSFAICYYFANKFSDESLLVADAAYNTPWYEGNLEMRKCVVILIARSQRPLEFTAGGLYPMTLPYFQSLLKVSYSYFTLLQRFNQN